MSRHPSGRRALRVVVLWAASSLAPSLAAAHFALLSPASWRAQDALGNPQKMGPCGDEGTAPLTGAVTAFAAGETITITLDETIFHPGHYRVALALDDRAELPAEPPVAPGATACGSVPIMSPVVFPVLADGMLAHTEPFTGSQTFQVTLPSDVSCTHCTLQVLEFMSSHPTPCFYHHCADISIGSSASCQTDAQCADDVACTVDTCDAVGGCLHRALALADVATGFLGDVHVPPCATEPVPAGIGKLFGRAEALLTRASQSPAKAPRLLNRATKRLAKAANKVAKVQDDHVSSECGAALGNVVGRAQTLVGCLQSGL